MSTFLSGPPSGQTLPLTPTRLSDLDGGVFDPGASVASTFMSITSCVYLHNILLASYILFSLVQTHLQLYMYACFILSGVRSFLVVLTCFSVVHTWTHLRPARHSKYV